LRSIVGGLEAFRIVAIPGQSAQQAPRTAYRSQQAAWILGMAVLLAWLAWATVAVQPQCRHNPAEAGAMQHGALSSVQHTTPAFKPCCADMHGAVLAFQPSFALPPSKPASMASFMLLAQAARSSAPTSWPNSYRTATAGPALYLRTLRLLL
jgi:hypothetical protein